MQVSKHTWGGVWDAQKQLYTIWFLFVLTCHDSNMSRVEIHETHFSIHKTKLLNSFYKNEYCTEAVIFNFLPMEKINRRPSVLLFKYGQLSTD